MKRFLIFVLILLTCSMYGQVKLKQLERDSIKFSVPTPKDQIIIAGDTSYSQRYIPGLVWLDSLGVSGVQDYYISNDTLFLVTNDSTYALLITHPINLDNDPANELQTLTENLSFIDITGSGTAAMTITSVKDRPVNITFHSEEGETLRPWWADAEDSWYYAHERFLSVTNTCGIDNSKMFNLFDEFGIYITDSCTFSLIFNEVNGITYPAGEIYFVPYSGNPNAISGDSVKFRVRNNSDVWYTSYYGPLTVIDGKTGSTYDYGKATIPISSAFIREFEVTYYGDIQISEILYFFNRENTNLPIPQKIRDNTYYGDNTFLEGIGDQYLSFGTDGQILTSDGSATYWNDPFDTSYLYSLIMDNDLWNRSNDTVSNDPAWNTLQLSDYGGGNHNIKGSEFAMFNSDGTITGWDVDSVDYSHTNEFLYDDTYIPNGFIRTNNRYNFPDFLNLQTHWKKLSLVPDLSKDEVKLTDEINLPAGQPTSIFISENGLNYFIIDRTTDSLYHYKLNVKNDLSTAYRYDAIYIASIANNADGFTITHNGSYIWIIQEAGFIYKCLLSTPYDISTITVETSYSRPQGGVVVDMQFFDDGRKLWLTNYSSQRIEQYTLSVPYDISTYSTDLNYSFSTNPWGFHLYENNLYVILFPTDILRQYSFSGDIDLANIVDTGNEISIGPAPTALHIYDGYIYKTDLTNDDVSQWVVKSRDTLYTTLSNKLDTSQTYLYSVDIYGNNVDTIRTGIVSYLGGVETITWCTNDTLYSGWYRHEMSYNPTEHDSIKPVFVIADTTSIKNVRLFLKQYQSESFDDSAIQARIDSVITVVDDHKTTDLDIDPTNEFQDLTFASDIIGLTNSAVTFDLSGYLDNTDAQDLDLTGNTLSLTGDASTVDLSGYLDNTDNQTLVATPGLKTLGIIGGNVVDMEELTFQIARDFFDHVSHSGVTVNIDDFNNEIDLTAAAADGNNYPTSFGWSTGTGILTLNRNGLSAINIDLDGRYLQSEVDGSTTNEIQQQSVANISGSYYLGNTSQSGNGIRLIEGSNITISGTTGTSGTITISSTGSTTTFDIVAGNDPTMDPSGTTTGYQLFGLEGVKVTGSNTVPSTSPDWIDFELDFTEFNAITSPVATDYIITSRTGATTEESKMLFSQAATYFSDGNGLWDSGNNNSLMASGITGYVNDYMAFYNDAGSSLILYVDDAATDFVGIRTSTQSNGAYLNVGGPVDISGNTWVDGFLTLGTLSGTPVALLGRTSTNIVTDDITIGAGLEFTSSTLKIDADYYGSTWAQGGFAINAGTGDRDLDILSMTTGGVTSTYFAYDAFNDRINIDVSGKYKVTLNFTYTSSTGGDISGVVYVRKTGVNLMPVYFNEAAANKNGTASKSEIHTLASTDYIHVYLDMTTAESVTLADIELIIEKVPD